MKILTSLVLACAFTATAITNAIAAPVNVNTATAQEIADALNGIGEKKAVAIVTYREENGPFTSLEDLIKVSGIGEKTVENNKADILLDAPTN